jgi:hypothetical protein
MVPEATSARSLKSVSPKEDVAVADRPNSRLIDLFVVVPPIDNVPLVSKAII